MKNCVILIVLFLLMSGCKKTVSDYIETKPYNAGVNTVFHIEQGDYFLNTYKIGVFNITSPAQMAIWIEDLKGNYINTIYVTKKFGSQKWTGGSDDDSITFRKETLPVWMFKARDAMKMPEYPTKNNPVADTITGATPEKSFKVASKIDSSLGEVVVCFEINMAFDNNDTYKKDMTPSDDDFNAASGQPSLIYKAAINLEEKGSRDLEFVGRSQPNGKSGDIIPDLSSITTAKNIVKNVKVVIE